MKANVNFTAMSPRDISVKFIEIINSLISIDIIIHTCTIMLRSVSLACAQNSKKYKGLRDFHEAKRIRARLTANDAIRLAVSRGNPW